MLRYSPRLVAVVAGLDVRIVNWVPNVLCDYWLATAVTMETRVPFMDCYEVRMKLSGSI